jgi:isovaleryl-CoA dehydrogenase
MSAAPERPNRSVSTFRLAPEHEEILDLASRFARDELWPLQARMDEEEWWPPQAMPALARMGFLGVTVPPELGGAGGDFFASGLITQGLARFNPAVALSYVAHENSASTTSPAMPARR